MPLNRLSNITITIPWRNRFQENKFFRFVLSACMSTNGQLERRKCMFFVPSLCRLYFLKASNLSLSANKIYFSSRSCYLDTKIVVFILMPLYNIVIIYLWIPFREAAKTTEKLESNETLFVCSQKVGEYEML